MIIHTVITFILRVLSHVQFNSGRLGRQQSQSQSSNSPRSLRTILLVWLMINSGSIIIHFLDNGSRGTKALNWKEKGENQWSSKGVLVDFIGQGKYNSLFLFQTYLRELTIFSSLNLLTSKGFKPTLLQIILLDLLMALLQFLLIILGFADPKYPQSTTISSAITNEDDRREMERDYTGLLGEEWARRVELEMIRMKRDGSDDDGEAGERREGESR